MTVASLMTLLLMAFALAAQPWSVLAGILLVTSQRGITKELFYVTGWVLALSVVFAVSVAVFPATPGDSSAQTPLHIAEIVLGLVLALFLLSRWRRPPITQRATEPAWLSKLDAMSPVLALALGAFLPNYIIVLAAAGQVLQLTYSNAVLLAIAVTFVVLASLGVAAPLGVRVFRPGQASAIYARWRTWLIENSRAVTYATGGLVAAVIVIKGIVGLITG